MALSRITIDDYEKPFYIYTDFDGDLLSVKICNTNGNAWQGTLTLQQLKTLADLRNITISMFVQETLEAFSCKSTDHLSFSVKSTDDAGSLELGWKKLSDGIKFQLGTISLIEAPSQSVHRFFLDQSLDCIAEMKQQVEKLEKTCTELTSQKQEALNSLRNYSVTKETIENELYGKFKLILNEKKAKIRVLMNSKSTLLDQNEEMKRLMRDFKSTSTQATVEAKRSVEDSPSPIEAVACTTSTNVESLLSDAYRPPSPPPTKQRLVSKGKRKGKVEIPQPPPLSSNKQPQLQDDNRDSSPDSNELLDML